MAARTELISARALGEFIDYAQQHPGVRFLRKDEIAR
jgi:hypothetical protein